MDITDKKFQYLWYLCFSIDSTPVQMIPAATPLQMLSVTPNPLSGESFYMTLSH